MDPELEPDLDPDLCLTDPDPGGPTTYRSRSGPFGLNVSYNYHMDTWDHVYYFVLVEFIC
jgi:hypothetical protein